MQAIQSSSKQIKGNIVNKSPNYGQPRWKKFKSAIKALFCFISYSTKDDEFARRLHSRMREANMRVWFAPEDLKGDKKLHE